MGEVHVEVAWETDPLTRPADEDWTRLGTVDPSLKIESLTTSRGVNIRTGDIETGQATAKIDDLNGNLDPSNAAGEWAPNVLPRRRIRFVTDPGADLLTWGGELLGWGPDVLGWDEVGETVLWTGFVSRLPIQWRREIQWTTIAAAGIFWLLAETPLPPSVLQVETLALEPTAYWPMTESTGRSVEDVAGTVDGELTYAAGGSPTVAPWAPGGQTFGIPNEAFPAGRSMVLDLPGTAQMTVAYWFRADVDANAGTLSNWAHSNVLPPALGSSDIEAISIGTVEPGGSGSVAVRLGGTTTGLAVVRASGDPHLRDGEPHHIALTLDSATDTVDVWIDGQHRPWQDDAADDAEIAAVDLAALVASLQRVRVGHGLSVVSAGSTEARGNVAHLAYFDRVLTSDEIASIYSAGVSAWAGDLTGTRLNRILDLAGVDEDDRDIAAGTQTCGPTLLDNGNVLEYVRKIAATEGGPVGEDPEGRIFLRDRIANDPTIVTTFSDDPDGDAGSPVAPLDPDYSLDRVINIARVTRENGTTQEATAPASEATYGPKTISLDTLHQSPAGSRAAAARQTIRNRDPRLVFPQVVADEIDTPADVMVGLGIGDACSVIARPPRGGDPIEQTSIVERVEHALAAGASWKTTFGVVEHTVLPDFWWDEPDQGWDESVWVAP